MTDTYYMRCKECRYTYPYLIGVSHLPAGPHGYSGRCKSQEWEPAEEADMRDNAFLSASRSLGWDAPRNEWYCDHGVGHPHKDQEKHPHHAGGTHGCDGCCAEKGNK